MKRLFLRLFMLIALTSLLAACGQGPRTEDVSGSAETRIPLPQQDGSYVMQLVELTGLDSLYEMGGRFVHFFMAPSIADGHLTGSAPKARFVKSGGVYVAADQLSLQLATVYAHMERLAKLDAELGVGNVNHWPRDVGVAVRLSGGMRNNAFYDGATDSMLFVPYSGGDLPLAVNAGILAHEHFHSLFYKLVTIPLNEAGKNPGRVSLTAHSQAEFYQALNMPLLKGSRDQMQKKGQSGLRAAYQTMLLRGLNEGLADFWGWLYTGDPDFIAYSLPSEKKYRTLRAQGFEEQLILSNGPTLRRTVGILETDQTHLSNNLVSYAYVIGTQYSRILKSLADTYAQDRQLDTLAARKEVARLILKTLPALKQDLLTMKSTDYYEPANFLLSLLKNIGDAKEDECKLFAEVMNKNDFDGNLIYSCEKSADSDAWSMTSKPATSDATATARAENLRQPPPASGVSFAQ